MWNAGWLLRGFGPNSFNPIAPGDSYTPAQVVGQLLVTAGEGTAPGDGLDWPVYVSRMPSPDSSIPRNAIGVFDTSGLLDGRQMSDGRITQHPGFQVRVRSSAYRDGFLKGEQIARALDSIRRMTVVVGTSSVRVDNLSRSSTVVWLGTDPDSRMEQFSLNGRCTLTPLEED